MQEFGIHLWLAPSLNLLADPRAADAAGRWSEDPVLTGVLAAALAEGVSKYGAAVLRHGDLPEDAAMSQSALRDTWLLPYEIAAAAIAQRSFQAARSAAKSSARTARLCVRGSWTGRYRGMFLADGERYVSGPQRIDLERSAIRILKLMLDIPK